MIDRKTNIADCYGYQATNKEVENEPERRNLTLNKLMNEHKQLFFVFCQIGIPSQWMNCNNVYIQYFLYLGSKFGENKRQQMFKHQKTLLHHTQHITVE